MKDLIVELNQKEKEEIFGGEEKKRSNNDKPEDIKWTNTISLGISFDFDYQEG
ncbi:hypothetical protein [Bacteroides rodentium]|jgi:hypothetical protein|uniref:hypothetical protein n=1 Tax=Bacteroides rodentium TaxID=691816 RepID=UPI000A84AB13|nr:hypothetical protein [Bacteroides rodentium]